MGLTELYASERTIVPASHESLAGSTPHDTDFIRTSFRRLIRSTVLAGAAVVFVHGLVFLSLGDTLWRFCAALVICAVPLYYMTAQQRSFPVFLVGTLALLAGLFVYVTFMAVFIGPGSGFQYLNLVAIPIVMVAGRIGLLSKWIIIFLVVTFTLALDSGMLTSNFLGPFTAQSIVGFHAFNIGLVALMLGLGAQKHFIVVAEHQKLLTLQSSMDPLTGLFNRRGLFEVADRNVARARRFGSPLAVILGDIDLFKLVNDQHCHATGDSVLIEVSMALKDMAREYDSVCRWGGEEFLIVLPDTTLEDAAAIAERIRQRFVTTPLSAGAISLDITMTMGVAQLGGFEMLEGTINRADQALYVGKLQGRNRVVPAS